MVKVYNEAYSGANLFINSGNGAYIYGETDKKYIDLSLGSGTMILGHSNEIIKKVFNETDGTIFTAPNRNTFEFSNTLAMALETQKDFVFANSGTEANMRAIRLARAITNKNKIAFFSGGWHGGMDMFLFEEDYVSEKVPKKKLKSSGIDKTIINETILLPYNDELAFEIIDKNKDAIAAVIIEPIQGSNPRDDIKNFLDNLRTITEQNNILLIFDEMISGFRVNLAGAKKIFNIEPDLSTYGKIVGGGLGIGVLAGKRDYMQEIDNKKVFMGGTFSANPLTMKLGNETIKYLLNNQILYNQLSENAEKMKMAINSYCIDNKIPCRLTGVESFLRLIFTDKSIKSRKERDFYEILYEIQSKFYYELLVRGIYISSNRIIFLSTQHNNLIIDEVIKNMIEVFEKLKSELRSY